MQAIQTSFQEFLQQKLEGSDWRDRKRLREEWLGALNRLLEQIREWIGESDPEGILECETYEVERVEGRLGVYDAPALKVRVNTDYAEVLPNGRFTPLPFPIQQMLSSPHHRQLWGDLSGGRVDVTNGEKRHMLLCSAEDGQDHWYALMTGRATPLPLDRDCLEVILKDLLS